MRNKQITIGALLSYGAIVFNILSGILYTPWIIWEIGSDQYALYTLAMSVVNFFMLDFGIGSAVSKFLANYYALGQQQEADAFLGIVYKVFLIISVIIAAILSVFYFLAEDIYLKLTPAELLTFKRLFIIVAVYSVCSFPFTTFNGVLMANEQFIGLKACNLGQRVLNVCIVVAALICGANVYVLVLANAASNVLFLIVKYMLIRKLTEQRAAIRSWNGMIAKTLFGFSTWVTIMNLAQRCIFNIMPSLIAAVIGSSAVTIFSLAATLESYVYLFADGISGMFLTKVSRILVDDQSGEELTKLMCKVGKFHVYTVGLLFIGFVAFGRDFVNLWLGSGFEAVYVCAILLIFPSIIDAPQQIAKTALLSQSVVKEQAIIYILMAVLNLVLSMFLLPVLGTTGAAISICIAYLVRTAAMNLLYYKRLSINLGVYFKNTYSHWIVIAVPTLLGGMVINPIISGSWLNLCTKIVVMTVIYLVGVALINRGAIRSLKKQYLDK